jgi:hypothetical protein
MQSRRDFLASASLAAAGVLGPRGSLAAPSAPVLAGQFQSSSGRTTLQYYRHTLPAGGPSSFRGPLQTLAGFHQAEVFLCGFTLKTAAHEAELARASVNVQKFRYDAQTGLMELGVTTQFATDGQGFAAEVTFVIIFTDFAAARFSRISTGCGGTAECHIVEFVPNAVPVGMQYIGIATQFWDVGCRTGNELINGIAGDVVNLGVIPAGVFLNFAGALRNSAWTNDMFCEWQGAVIAFDPTEMSRALTSLPFQYTIIGNHITTRQTYANQAPAPPSTVVKGFLDAFQGLTLLYSQSISGPETPLWMIEGSADPPIMGPSGAISQYGVFLGSRFGDAVNAMPRDYGFQISRAAGFLL